MADDYESTARSNMNLDLLRPYRCGDRIHEISVPIFVMSGMDDVRVPVANLEDGMKGGQDGELCPVDQCGHMLQPNTLTYSTTK